jgi:hypothetical protein
VDAVTVAVADERITLPGAATDVRAAFEAHAHSPRLSCRHAVSTSHENTVTTIGRVSIRNQRSRWAAAPRAGRSRSLAIDQMPPEVSDYVILHELMRASADHSRQFWREVAACAPVGAKPSTGCGRTDGLL